MMAAATWRPWRGGNDDGPNHDAGDDNGRRGAEHIGRDGTKVEINGNDIEVVHASGIKEEIENGRFEMKDASGRTIVERPATAADIARLASSRPVDSSRSGTSIARRGRLRPLRLSGRAQAPASRSSIAASVRLRTPSFAMMRVM